MVVCDKDVDAPIAGGALEGCLCCGAEVLLFGELGEGFLAFLRPQQCRGMDQHACTHDDTWCVGCQDVYAVLMKSEVEQYV